MGRPPGQLGEDTRKAILVAAREAFAKLGFERATNAEIAAAAGVTAAAMYRHYASKLDLYGAAVRDASAVLLPTLRTAVADQESVRAAFRAMLGAMRSFDDTQLSAARFLSELPVEMQRHPRISKQVLEEPGEIFALYTKLVESGVRTREISADKAPRAVSVLIATFMGVAAYTRTLGPVFGEQAIMGFIDLVDGQLFRALGEH